MQSLTMSTFLYPVHPTPIKIAQAEIKRLQARIETLAQENADLRQHIHNLQSEAIY